MMNLKTKSTILDFCLVITCACSSPVDSSEKNVVVKEPDFIPSPLLLVEGTTPYDTMLRVAKEITEFSFSSYTKPSVPVLYVLERRPLRGKRLFEEISASSDSIAVIDTNQQLIISELGIAISESNWGGYVLQMRIKPNFESEEPLIENALFVRPNGWGTYDTIELSLYREAYYIWRPKEGWFWLLD